MVGSFALSIVLFLSFSVTIEFMNHTLTPLRPWTADLSIISPDNTCSVNRDFIDKLQENSAVKTVYGRMFAYEVPLKVNGVEKKVDLISYEERQFGWAKDYLLEGDIEADTLRYCERIGFLTSVNRNSSGNRNYTEDKYDVDRFCVFIYSIIC